MFSLIVTQTFSFLTSSDLKSLTVMFCTHPKVVDPCVGDLVFDPVERGVVARAVLLLRQTQSSNIFIPTENDVDITFMK